MAAVAGTETVTITVNDVELSVPKGELIVESVKQLGIDIPIFCYHSRLKPVGMCRMCLVDVGFKQDDGSVRNMPKPQAACTLPADENMVVYTDFDSKFSGNVIEVLSTHPYEPYSREASWLETAGTAWSYFDSWPYYQGHG